MIPSRPHRGFQKPPVVKNQTVDLRTLLKVRQASIATHKLALSVMTKAGTPPAPFTQADFVHDRDGSVNEVATLIKAIHRAGQGPG